MSNSDFRESITMENVSVILSFMSEEGMLLEDHRKDNGYIYFVSKPELGFDFEIIYNEKENKDRILKPSLVRFTNHDGDLCWILKFDAPTAYPLGSFEQQLEKAGRKMYSKEISNLCCEMRGQFYNTWDDHDYYNFVKSGDREYFDYFTDTGKHTVIFDQNGIVQLFYGLLGDGELKIITPRTTVETREILEIMERDLNDVVLL